ncbi:MAG: 30S ribosomal protein S4 [Leptospiraceae bacterium]|nr:30S ribosomal protein S4 [Leptospiraceae bacterium]MDW7976521.1 30S ribosomal protein S4 [Leptospiraceae bacterium]
MATLRKPRHKICRYAGFCLYGNPKCPSTKRPYPPGYRPESLRKKKTPYGEQLLEKQKLRLTYGMMERQFYNTFVKATRLHGNTADNFIKLLESRLMTLVYRLKLARTIFDARQLISHGHITVDGKRVTIPSYQVKPGSIIGVAEKSKNLARIKEAIALREGKTYPVPYLEVQADGISGKFLGIQNIQDVPLDPRINILKVIEFYSK